MDKWINGDTLQTPDDGGDGKLDKISALPDAILCHILSFLPGTKQSAATSILSSRWRYLFASLRDIDLISTDPIEVQSQSHARILKKNSKFDDRRISDLINFGNRLIQLRNGTPIRRFRLSVMCDAKYQEALLTLISAALSCKVQELEIFADCVHRFPHNAIFTCKTLVSFKLYWPNLDLQVPESICLPNLKSLYLERLRMVDWDSFLKLIHGCPFLEQLFCSLYCFVSLHCLRYLSRQHRNLKVFHISNPMLKKLTLKVSPGSEFITLVVESNNLESFHYKVYGSPYEFNFIVTVNAPNLKYLYYKGPLDGVHFNQSSKSLVRVELLVWFCNCRSHSQDVFAFLDKMQSVESLYLTEHILQVLHQLPMLPTFENLKRLELEPMYDFPFDHIQSWKNLQSLTESAPNLEVLIFDHVYRSNCIANGLPEMIPKCCIQHLQEVEITNFRGNKHDFRLVEYLLQNGKALKKITLGGYCQEIQRSFRRRKSIKISHDCQIVVAKPQDMMKANIYYYLS